MLMLSRDATIIVAVTLVATALSAFGADADATVPPQMRDVMLHMPRPIYPFEARARRITGSGVCELVINPATGVVTRVVVVHSSRSKLLDKAAVKAYSQWRARPGKISRIRVPFTFTLAAGCSQGLLAMASASRRQDRLSPCSLYVYDGRRPRQRWLSSVSLGV